MGDYPSTEEILATEAQSQPAAPAQAEPAKQESVQAPQQTKTPEQQFLDFEKFKTHHVTYKANGKEVKEPLEKVLNRASQGYNYAQLMEQLKERGKQFDTWEQEKASLSKWKQFDDYAAKNQAWAKHVEEMWEKKGQYSDPNRDPNDPQVQIDSRIQQMFENFSNQFGQKLSGIEEFINGQKSSQADKDLDGVVSQVRDQFKQIDFDEVDDQGKSVEYKVLEHMQQNGIKNFKTAFVDLYHDQLVNTAKSKALEADANERQKQTKQGIMGVSSTPKFSTQPESFSVRGKSYEQLAEMAKDALRQHA